MSGYDRGSLAVAAILALALLGGPARARGSLTIETIPGIAGSQVIINNQAAGLTDANGRAMIPSLPAGQHVVHLSVPDGRRFSQSVVIIQGLASRLAFDVPSRLDVVTNVAGASLELDGQPVGSTGRDGAAALVVGPGRHRLRVAATGHLPEEREVDVLRGRLTTVAIRLQPTRKTDWESVATMVMLGVSFVATGSIAVRFVIRRRRHTDPVKRIDRYEIRGVLGRGGMATVYAARDTMDRIKGTVALKVMDEGLLWDDDLVRKFLREGDILASLNLRDPDAPLARVHHFGRAVNTARTPFIAMERIEGKSLLAHLSEKGRLTVKEAAMIVLGVGRALQPAHVAGVYHLDVSLENVILTKVSRGGFRLRLIDFGVARHEYTPSGILDRSIEGKPMFMSPEQCQGAQVDARSDIYSLGVVLYTLVAGSPPFTSGDPVEVMRQHREAPVPYGHDFPESVRSVVAKALEKDRDRRHQTLTEFLEEVRRLA